MTRKKQTRSPKKSGAEENLKYLSRNFYYGKLVDWEFVSDAMVLIFSVYTATQYFGKSTNIRVYVPTDMEDELCEKLVTGDNYFIISVPYKIKLSVGYQHRVDLLLNIFKEI